jgi:hypothetical protein
MTKPRQFPAFNMLIVPPDPRRKSNHLVIISQKAKHAPLEVFCSNSCIERGRARESDNGCRHTDLVLAQIRPWWRARARVVGLRQPSPQEPTL